MVVKSALKKVMDKMFSQLECSIDENQNSISLKLLCAFRQSYKIGAELSKWGESAVDDLIDYAKEHTGLDYRLAILQALGDIGSERAVSFIAECLESDEFLERKYAASALAKLKNPKVIAELKTALEKEDVVRKEIYEALFCCSEMEEKKRLYEKAKNEKAPEIRKMALEMTVLDEDQENFEKLIEALQDKQMGVVYAAVKKLKKFGSIIVPRLVDLLTEKGRYTRTVSVELLGHFKDERAVLPLCEQLLESRNKALRAQVAVALRKIKSELAVESLCLALEDESTEVQSEAAKTLAVLKSPFAINYLLQYLEKGEKPFHSSADHVVTALAKIKTEESNKALIKVLDLGFNDVQRIAADFLAKNKCVEALQPLQTVLEKNAEDDSYRAKDVRKAFETSIYKLTELAAKQKSQKTTKAKSGTVTKSKKGKKGKEADGFTILELLQSEDVANKKKALTMIIKTGDTHHTVEVEELLYHEDKSVRTKAMQAIVSLDTGNVVKTLIQSLGSEDKTRLPHVIEALGLSENNVAVEALLPFIVDDEAHIRQKSKTALKRLKIDQERLTDYEIQHNVQKFVSTGTGSPGQAKKLGDKAIEPLAMALTNSEIPLKQRQRAAWGLKALDWEPETEKEKVTFYWSCGPIDKLNGSTGKSLDVLISLYRENTDYITAKTKMPKLMNLGEKAVAAVFDDLGKESVGMYNIDEYVPYYPDHKERFIDIIKGDDPVARENSARVLARVADPEVFQVIIDVLQNILDQGESQDDSGAVLCETLGAYKDKRALPILFQAAKTRENWANQVAISFGEIGSKEACFVLMDLLKKTTDEFTRQTIGGALEKIGWQPQKDLEKAEFFLASSNFKELRNQNLGHHVVPGLLERLENDYAKLKILEVLAKVDDDQVIEPITKLIGTPANSERDLAFELTKKYGEKALPYIRQVVQNSSPSGKRNAAILLGSLKDEESVDLLLPLLESEWDQLLKAAADALGKLKAGGAAGSLVNLLGHKSPAVQRAAITALGKLKNADAVDHLRQMKAADKKIGELRDKTIQKLERS